MRNKLMMLIVVTTMLVASYFGNHYTVSGYVSNITPEIIELTDDCGEIWEIDYETGYKEGDLVKITFCDLENCNRRDDIVTNVRKIRK